MEWVWLECEVWVHKPNDDDSVVLSYLRVWVSQPDIELHRQSRPFDTRIEIEWSNRLLEDIEYH